MKMNTRIVEIVLLFAVVPMCIAAPNPASTAYVDQQVALLQNQINNVQPGLTAASWAALCPTSNSLTASAGCSPDCAGSQAKACNTVLSVTNMLGLFALPSATSDSLIAFSVTPTSTLTNQGPSITRPGSGINAYCTYFSQAGELMPGINNSDNGGGDNPNGTFQSSAFIFFGSSGSSSHILNIYLQPPSNNPFYSAASNTYYVLCSAFTVSSNAPISASTAGITANWT